MTGLVGATVLIGVAAASDSVAPGAMMGDVVAGRGGTVVAVFQMAGDLGLVLGPVVTGWVVDSAGYSPAFVVCAVVCAAGVRSPRRPRDLQRQRVVSPSSRGVVPERRGRRRLLTTSRRHRASHPRGRR